MGRPHMEKRNNRTSSLLKSHSDEINALNKRFEAMKKSLSERHARELAHIKQKHQVQLESLKSRDVGVEAAQAASATKH